MTRQDYYPTKVADQVIWLGNFGNKIAGYATKLGLNAGQVTAITNDASWLAYVLGTWLPAVRAWQKSCTDAAVQAQTGTMGTTLVLPVFTAPDLPENVTAQNDGALQRIFVAVQTIKKALGYTEAIGTDIGVEGGGNTPPDYATVQPEISAKIIAPNQTKIGWGWQGMSAFLDQCEIHVDRGSGWTLLTIDTTPGYLDTHPHPATLTKWKYRAIYRNDDHQVGQWSTEATINVGG